jgi:hypothetical protein
MNSIHGQCHCGGVTFTCDDDVVAVIACHCRDCQQMHGNYNAMAAVPREALAIAEPTTLVWYQSSDKARRGFCSSCGSRLFKDNLGSPKMMVSMGVINPPTGFRFIRHLWTESKGDWYDVPPLG